MWWTSCFYTKGRERIVRAWSRCVLCCKAWSKYVFIVLCMTKIRQFFRATVFFQTAFLYVFGDKGLLSNKIKFVSTWKPILNIGIIITILPTDHWTERELRQTYMTNLHKIDALTYSSHYRISLHYLIYRVLKKGSAG